jgi:iron(III) transport system substrate-binding protein
MNISRRTFLASGAAFGAIALNELSRSRPGMAQNQVLNLYTSRHYPADGAIYERFLKDTGIKINLVESPGDKLIERLKSEGANSPADVVITVDAGNLWRLDQEGLLQAVDSATLTKRVPSELRSSNGTWYGFTKRARVIMYNKDRFDRAQLNTYEDLADPKFKGKILVRSSGNIYNQSLVGSILAATNGNEGAVESWVKGVVANFARKPEGNDTAQIKALASGQGDIAISNTYYLARLAQSNKPEEQEIASKIGIIFPNQKDRGTHVNISGGGIAKNAPNRDAAIKFLEYLTTVDAQNIFAGSNNEYPVVGGVSMSEAVKRYGQFKSDKLSAEVFAGNNQKALMIMDRGGWK